MRSQFFYNPEVGMHFSLGMDHQEASKTDPAHVVDFFDCAPGLQNHTPAPPPTGLNSVQ